MTVIWANIAFFRISFFFINEWLLAPKIKRKDRRNLKQQAAVYMEKKE
jgi:hypothetical protein